MASERDTVFSYMAGSIVSHLYFLMVALSSLALLVAVGHAFGKAESHEPDDPRVVLATVYYCHDGDTCRVLAADGLWLNVRLAGIDAPEVASSHSKHKGGQPMGDEARDFLNDKLKGKSVTIRQTDLDPFNRPVVEIMLADQNVNIEVIRAGLAEAYRGRTKRIKSATYFAAEEQAKAAKKGLWAMKSYQSPKAFRSSR